MARSERSNGLERFRRRAAADPFFIGHVLERLARERGFGDPELAMFLGCETARLAPLMACRSPDPKSEQFAAEVRQIAEYVGCNEVRLLSALREVSVLGVLRAVPALAAGEPPQSGLLAARQRRNKESSEGRRGRHRGRDDDRPRST